MRVGIVAIIVFLSLITIEANIQDTIKAKVQQIMGNRRIQISIETGDKTFVLEVEPTDTVKSLKAMIQNKEGIPADQQRLFYENDELLDSYTLEYYDIKDGSIITLEQADYL